MARLIAFFYFIWLYIINYLVKPALALQFFLRFNVHYHNVGIALKTRGPFLMLPNHTNQWDPFLISMPTVVPIRWVASDAAFREAMKPVLLIGGAIPKVKEQSDMVTLQEVKKAMEMKVAAGIFPEGQQNWDGRTQDLIPATAKLVRFLKVPVIAPLIQGGYLTKPRWTWKPRRCRIDVDFRVIVNAEEIKTLNLSEIEERIRTALDHDEYDWQRKNMAPIRSEARAEHMELAHFACPACRSMGSLSSSGNTLACSCGYRVEVDRYGFFVYPEDGPSFDSPHDWTLWQNSLLEQIISDALDRSDAGADPDPVLLRDADITLMRGARAMPMLPVLHGEARLYRDRIEVGVQGGTGGELVSIPLREATAVNTFKQQKFEFRFEKRQYRFRFPLPGVSGYKWEMACRILRRVLIERGQW